MSDGIDVINEKVRNESAFIETLVREIEKVIVGQRYLIDRLLIGLFANGHILVEGTSKVHPESAIVAVRFAPKSKAANYRHGLLRRGPQFTDTKRHGA